jgi:O-acetyl-ADP-ribose deacetylase (regulator of RNase III)
MELPADRDYYVSLRVGDPDEVRLLRGDLTRYPAEAIVNAANSQLLPGSGVCGAIHFAGGRSIAEECQRIRLERGALAAGEAVATTAGSLDAQYVIHTVGPIWHGGQSGEAALLSRSYRESMRIADELKLHTIAFPAISTGAFGYPVAQAAAVAIPAVIGALRSAKHLVMASIVLFDKTSLDAFAKAAFEQKDTSSGASCPISIGILD